MQELYNFACSYKDQEAAVDDHPAGLVLDMFGAKDESQRALHCQQIETWFSEYANFRGLPSIFKPIGQDSFLNIQLKDFNLCIPLQVVK